MASAKMSVRVSPLHVLLAVVVCFGVASLLLSPASNAQSRAASSDVALQSRLQTDVNALTRFASRAPGTLGNAQAAAYMQSRFAQIFGAGKVKVESYQVTAPVTKSATLNGQPVYPIYPNAVVPSTTPIDGIRAPMVYAGQGLPQNFNGQKIDGAIVVLEFNSGLGWITAADLGARAVVFLEPQATVDQIQRRALSASQPAPSSRGEAERKFASLPIEVPRYYAPRSLIAGVPANSTTGDDNSLQGAVAVGNGVLKSVVRWERVTCRNVLGTIQGTDPNIANKPGGTLIIGGYYDSMAITPDLAPGAEAAGNAAALLELARQFKARPPKYSVLFLAEGAHHIALAGMRNFAAQHFIDTTGKGDKAVKDRIDSYKGFVGLDLTSRTNTVGLFAKSSFYNQMTVGAENILLNQFADFAKTMNAQAGQVVQAAAFARRRILRRWRDGARRPHLAFLFAFAGRAGLGSRDDGAKTRRVVCDRQRCAHLAGHAF